MNKFVLTTLVLLPCLLSLSPAHAFDTTGRVSVSAGIAYPQEGDLSLTDDSRMHTDQESLRLMLGDGKNNSEWSFHLKALRQHYQGAFPIDNHSSNYFRYKTLSSDWVDEQDADSATYIGAEVDRASIKYSQGKYALTAGRQAIEWGSGRFWQPLNVFGAFAPTDLDTEYKPGIDAATLNWFPSEFSTLTAAYVLSPDDDLTDTKNSAVLHYKGLVGEQSELSLLAGEVSGDRVLGVAIEGEKSGVGLRLEAVHHDPESVDDDGFFVIAGADYKFSNEITLTTELYHNDFGADQVSELTEVQNSWLLTRGLQPHLSRNVVGISVQKELTPLLNGSYTLLGSQLNGSDGDREYSFLHQLNLNYSLGDESDLLFSVQSGVGRGSDPSGHLQSEFGHVPVGVTVRMSHYF